MVFSYVIKHFETFSALLSVCSFLGFGSYILIIYHVSIHSMFYFLNHLVQFLFCLHFSPLLVVYFVMLSFILS